jgi:hypothetical protein
MAQPPTYTPAYNFSDYQTTNPSAPLPASQLDAELNSAKETLDALNTNIAKIQRDDGKLLNQSVHKDSLGVDTLALIGASGSGFNPQGAWTGGTDYAVGDLVTRNNATYLATEAHTASTAFDSDSANWVLIANAAISTTASAVDLFEGDAAATQFVLTYEYPDATAIQVYVNGELQIPVTDYDLVSGSPDTIEFTSAPPSPATPGETNVVVWGTSVSVELAKSEAQASASSAADYRDVSANHRTTASRWATEVSTTVVDAETLVDSGDYSAKEWAVGIQTRSAASGGSSRDWATYTGGTVDDTDYSAKYWANQSQTLYDDFDGRYKVGATDPYSAKDEGDLWYDSTSNVLKYWNGTDWDNVESLPQALDTTDTPTFATPTASGHAATKGYVDTTVETESTSAAIIYAIALG